MVKTNRNCASDLVSRTPATSGAQQETVKKTVQAVHKIWALHIAIFLQWLLFFIFFPADTIISMITDATSDWKTLFQNGLFISTSFLLISLIYNQILINVHKSRIADLRQEAQP